MKDYMLKWDCACSIIRKLLAIQEKIESLCITNFLSNLTASNNLTSGVYISTVGLALIIGI